jgi:hypothetical protein
MRGESAAATENLESFSCVHFHPYICFVLQSCIAEMSYICPHEQFYSYRHVFCLWLSSLHYHVFTF